MDLQRLYGAAEWSDREKFFTMTRLWEVPGRDMALVLYAIGEVGVSKQIGRLAVLNSRAAPRPVYRPRELCFWDLYAQTFRFNDDGALVYCYEFGATRVFGNANPASFTCRLAGLNLERGLVGRLPHDSADFDLRRAEIAALVWRPWA